jgi:hypothetical protein
MQNTVYLKNENPGCTHTNLEHSFLNLFWSTYHDCMSQYVSGVVQSVRGT